MGGLTVRILLAVVASLLLSGCWQLTIRVPVPWGGNAELMADFRERHEENQRPPSHGADTTGGEGEDGR
jgi:hypothetical protein